MIAIAPRRRFNDHLPLSRRVFSASHRIAYQLRRDLAAPVACFLCFGILGLLGVIAFDPEYARAALIGALDALIGVLA